MQNKYIAKAEEGKESKIVIKVKKQKTTYEGKFIA